MSKRTLWLADDDDGVDVDVELLMVSEWVWGVKPNVCTADELQSLLATVYYNLCGYCCQLTFCLSLMSFFGMHSNWLYENINNIVLLCILLGCKTERNVGWNWTALALKTLENSISDYINYLKLYNCN